MAAPDGKSRKRKKITFLCSVERTQSCHKENMAWDGEINTPEFGVKRCESNQSELYLCLLISEIKIFKL